MIDLKQLSDTELSRALDRAINRDDQADITRIEAEMNRRKENPNE